MVIPDSFPDFWLLLYQSSGRKAPGCEEPALVMPRKLSPIRDDCGTACSKALSANYSVGFILHYYFTFFLFLHQLKNKAFPKTKYLGYHSLMSWVHFVFFSRGNCHPGKDFPVVQLSLQLYFIKIYFPIGGTNVFSWS